MSVGIQQCSTVLLVGNNVPLRDNSDHTLEVIH
jgi:hypothetical protein